MPGCRSWKVHQYVLSLVTLLLCMPSHKQAIQLVLSLLNMLCQVLLPRYVIEAMAIIVAHFSHLFSASSWLTWLVLCTRACVDCQTCLQKPRQWHSSLWILSRYRDPPAQCQVSPSYELSKLSKLVAESATFFLVIVNYNDALCVFPDAYSGQMHM